MPLLFIFLICMAAALSPALGNLECEELSIEDCAFAVSWSGARCVLEKYVVPNGPPQHKCQTSIIMAEKAVEWIESDSCIDSCGLQRMSVGLSTDALLERDFARRLCSPQCQDKCPNIVDLYTKLAAGEGLFLPHLCNAMNKPQRSRRLITDAPFKSENMEKEKMMPTPLESWDKYWAMSPDSTLEHDHHPWKKPNMHEMHEAPTPMPTPMPMPIPTPSMPPMIYEIPFASTPIPSESQPLPMPQPVPPPQYPPQYYEEPSQDEYYYNGFS